MMERIYKQYSQPCIYHLRDTGASSCNYIFYRYINQLFYMQFDDAGYILGATVTQLGCVLIKNFVMLAEG